MVWFNHKQSECMRNVEEKRLLVQVKVRWSLFSFLRIQDLKSKVLTSDIRTLKIKKHSELNMYM